jgi:hypothetical protein
MWVIINNKLSGSYLWFCNNRTLYQALIPNRKEGWSTRLRRGDVGSLVRRVFIDPIVGRI